MADSNIGSLPQAANLDDDSLLVAEQQGRAVKVTGAQFKEFGRQAVIGQVQGYVDQAEAAANRAADVVSAVTNMTVEAATLPTGQSATVTKTMKQGKVNLAFGLPRGEQGVPGPTGATGPRGPQGAPGTGLKILGYYDTLADLEAAVTSPNAGDAYGVGTEVPYNIFVFDGVTGTWKDNGQLSGGGGGPLPENVVTTDGGASMTFPVDLGDGPHTITFTDDAEPPLTAEDVQYSTTQNVKQAIDGLKSSVSNGKALIASAITDKGVTTAQDATFAQMAENIEQISGGSDTSDATATSFDILAPKTAYTAAGKVEGTIPTLLGQTIMPGTADKTIANGQYLGGTQVIKGDPNLTSGNIKSGVTLFGVEGALESTFQATLTVTADIGAVVTATHSGGTEVEALSTTGTVVLDLPLEGTWTVTAVRGVAQYNTVTIQVSSSYSATLTAEVHVEYFGEITPFSEKVSDLASASLPDYALFCGGYLGQTSWGQYVTSAGWAYDINLTKTNHGIHDQRYLLSAAATENVAMFAGGKYYKSGLQDTTQYKPTVSIYDNSLVLTQGADLSVARCVLGGASIGNHCLFGGGESKNGDLSIVDAYNEDGTRSEANVLSTPSSGLSAASNENYAIFGGGNTSSAIPTAYDENLTRTFPSSLTVARKNLSAAKAGNYVLFAGGDGPIDTVEAYDLFLTRTIPEVLSVARFSLKGTTLNGVALFSGGKINTNLNEDDYSDAVDGYDQYLVHSTITPLANRRSNHAAASIGSYALFGGGAYYSSGVLSNVRLDSVEAYRYV